MGSDDYFDWRERMERRQRESEWQVQSLLCKIRKQKKENDELRAQVLSLGLSHNRQQKGQRATLRQNDEVSFP